MQTIQLFKPQGYKTLNNYGGMEIMIDDVSEEVHYRYTDGETVYSSCINYDQDGDPYFMEEYRNTVHYLNEFIKY